MSVIINISWPNFEVTFHQNQNKFINTYFNEVEVLWCFEYFAIQASWYIKLFISNTGFYESF